MSVYEIMGPQHTKSFKPSPSTKFSSYSCSQSVTKVGLFATLGYLAFVLLTKEQLQLIQLSLYGLYNHSIENTYNVDSSDPLSHLRIYKPDYSYESHRTEWESQWGPVQSIILLGERHSGTNWITNHLERCFNHSIVVSPLYKRFKHWFQEDDPKYVPHKSAIVVSMFRDPYDWVWAMMEEPHHAHDHIGLPWLKFVTKPWIGRRGKHDLDIVQTGMKSNVTCLERYSFVDIMPCSRDDSQTIDGYADYKYELNHDGSERAYPSIVDMRKDKIENHLSVSMFNGTRAFYPFRYEDLEAYGTEVLLSLLENATGIERKCNAVKPTGKVKHKKVEKEYVKWMNQFVDWDVEGLIGYNKR